MASTQILPPPYKGENYQFPLISIQNPNCERMENFNNKGGILALRKGHDNFAIIASTSAVALNLSSYSPPFTTKLFLMVQNVVAATPGLRWYDITAGGAGTLVNTVAVGGDDEIHTLYYNGYLYYMGETTLSGAPIYYNGSAWGAAAMTWPSAFNPFGGNVYKNRGYFAERQGTRYVYTNIDQVGNSANTPTAVDLKSIISSPAFLYGIRSISSTQATTQQNVQAFLFSNGEILVYSGSYPDSADWSLDSRFKISELIYNNTFIDAKGDTFIFSKTEILSLRNLFLTGYDQERAAGIGASIQPRWAQIVQGLTALSSDTPIYIKGIYDEKLDRLVLNLPRYVDPVTGAVVSNSSAQLIYDFILGAWYEYWQVYSVAAGLSLSACYCDGAIYNTAQPNGSAVAYKLDSLATFVDDDLAGTGTAGIVYKNRSAPLPIAKFGANAIDGVEAICKTDLYPQTNYKFIGDLGRVSTAAQVLPDQGSSVAKPMMNVGLQSVITTQLEISGTSVSSSLGLEIYALNVWYNQGPPASR